VPTKKKAPTKSPADDKAEAKKPKKVAAPPPATDAAADDKKKRGPKAAAKPGAARDEDGDGDSEEEDDEEEDFTPKKSAAAKPAAEPTAVVPARRLTPEAKAQINAMVQKGVPLDEALRRAASWETFIAPVKDETQKGAFPGKDGNGPRSPFGGRRPSGPRGDKNDKEGGQFNFEDEDPGVSISDDNEPIVAGGDDD
jgi:hypothetical protein